MAFDVTRDKAMFELARSQRGLVTRRQLLELGLTDLGIRSRVDAAMLYAVARGVYRVAGSMTTWEQRALALCLVMGQEATLSHSSAARVWTFDLPTREIIEITLPAARRSERTDAGLVVHRSRHLARDERAHWAGFQVTTPARTFIDIAARHDGKQLRRAIDDAVVRQLVRPKALATLLTHSGQRVRSGTRALRKALEPWLDSRPPASVAEATLLRSLLGWSIPPPTCQYKVFDGRIFVARLDFAWPDARVAVEMDGFRYHATPEEAFGRDSLRWVGSCSAPRLPRSPTHPNPS